MTALHIYRLQLLNDQVLRLRVWCSAAAADTGRMLYPGCWY